MTVSESDRSSPLFVSTALCSRSSHLSLFRLEPNSSRFCFSCAQGAGETKEEASATYSAITTTQRIDLYRIMTSSHSEPSAASGGELRSHRRWRRPPPAPARRSGIRRLPPAANLCGLVGL